MSGEEERTGETCGLASFMAAERARIFDAATPQRREQMRAAQAARRVYDAWNAVCSGTREGEHVTGLHYLPESNELLVYLDGAPWVTEMTLLREIIRARMAIKGVDIAGFVFRVSRPEYAARAQQARFERSAAPELPTAHRQVCHTALDPDCAAAMERDLAPIEDERLRQALKNAMTASFTTKTSTQAPDRP